MCPERSLVCSAVGSALEEEEADGGPRGVDLELLEECQQCGYGGARAEEVLAIVVHAPQVADAPVELEVERDDERAAAHDRHAARHAASYVSCSACSMAGTP